jgi:hypothetical protein
MKNFTRLLAFFAVLCMVLFPLLFFSGCASTPPGYASQLHPPRAEYIAVQEVQEDGRRVIDTTRWTENQRTEENTQAVPNGREAVQVRANEGGVQVGFDLLGIRNYQAGEWARRSWGPLKIVTYPLDYIGYMAVNHPGQTLAMGLAAWEIADSGVSDLFGGGSDSSSGKATAPTTNSGTVIQVTGNQNTVTFSPVSNPAPVPTLTPSAAE